MAESCRGTKGGTGGSDGHRCKDAGGKGQGDYTAQLSQFGQQEISAGEGGGPSGFQTYFFGGGAGGILVNDQAPAAGSGSAHGAYGYGGQGYGAGGGSGGLTSAHTCGIGGAGAPGLVYIEWG